MQTVDNYKKLKDAQVGDYVLFIGDKEAGEYERVDFERLSQTTNWGELRRVADVRENGEPILSAVIKDVEGRDYARLITGDNARYCDTLLFGEWRTGKGESIKCKSRFGNQK